MKKGKYIYCLCRWGYPNGSMYMDTVALFSDHNRACATCAEYNKHNAHNAVVNKDYREGTYPTFYNYKPKDKNKDAWWFYVTLKKVL